jgi:hypothetical protein
MNQPLTVEQLIRLLRQFPRDSLAFALDCGEGNGVQVTTPDGEDELGFVELPTGPGKIPEKVSDSP